MLAAANERSRIAREMHDVVAHSLAVMITMSDSAAAAIDRNPQMAKEALEVLAEMDAEIVEKLDSMNVKYLFGEKPEELDFDLIVVSPGVPLYIDLLKEAKEKGIKIIGELELK